MPEVRIDLEKLEPSRVLAFIAPIFPGSLLLLSVLFRATDLATAFLGSAKVGYTTKVFVLAFAAYFAGLILYVIINACVYILLSLFAHKIFNWLKPTFEPWKTVEWRKAAKKLLGDDLTPDIGEPVSETEYNLAIGSANAIPDQDERLKALLKIQETFYPRQREDWSWYYWYQILHTRFTRPNPVNVFGAQLASILHATGWAGVVLMAHSHFLPRYLWFLFSFMVIIGFIGAFAAFWYGVQDYDPYGYSLGASMLREIDKRAGAAATDESRSDG